MATTYTSFESIRKVEGVEQLAPSKRNYKRVSGLITFDATPADAVIETGCISLEEVHLSPNAASVTVLYSVISDSTTVPGTKLLTIKGTASKTAFFTYAGPLAP